MRENKYSAYLKTSGIFLGVFSLIFFTQWFFPISLITRWLRYQREWNWTWPIALGIGTYLFQRWNRQDTDLKKMFRVNPWVLVALTVIFMIGSRFTHLQFASITIGTLIYQFLASTAEEFFFRGAVLKRLSDWESDFYADKTLKKLVPVSLIFVSLVFASMHGLNPILRGTGHFDWAWFAKTFESSILFSYVYLITRSPLASGWVHFLSNLIS